MVGYYISFSISFAIKVKHTTKEQGFLVFLRSAQELLVKVTLLYQNCSEKKILPIVTYKYNLKNPPIKGDWTN